MNDALKNSVEAMVAAADRYFAQLAELLGPDEKPGSVSFHLGAYRISVSPAGADRWRITIGELANEEAGACAFQVSTDLRVAGVLQRIAERESIREAAE